MANDNYDLDLQKRTADGKIDYDGFAGKHYIGPTGQPVPPVRTFESGATRDTADGKFDYEAFLSPLVLHRYAEFMHKNRLQKDGSLRDGDNWQRGIDLQSYMKSGWRHFMCWWSWHRGHKDSREGLDDALCAILFNVSGYLHETLKARREGK